MAFEVLPAVDVAGGHLARLTGNGTVGLDAFGGDPLAAATAFAGKGARWIHVVDLDRALTGASRSPGVVAAIAALPGIRVQASGGIVQAGDAAGPLEDGASRVVLGSGALADRASFERTVDSLGDAVVVGLEVAGERVHPRGAAEVELSLEDTLGWLGDVEVPRYLFTDLERFGRLSGTDVDRVARLARVAARPLVVAGGVSTTEDVRRVAEIGPPVEGVVVGRALYEGADLGELLAAAAAE